MYKSGPYSTNLLDATDDCRTPWQLHDDPMPVVAMHKLEAHVAPTHTDELRRRYTPGFHRAGKARQGTSSQRSGDCSSCSGASTSDSVRAPDKTARQSQG